MIVALGASAGGLEALQGFFAGMPSDPRFAFVVVTHLSPQHESRMAEVLRRATSMSVNEAQDADQIEPGHVYVIPPNRLMGIRQGRLCLEEAAPRPTIPHPIDYFMRALAEDQQECSAGIVFSGADHDGTAGLKEIKAAGGLAIVQDPDTAQFPGMPRSAIDASVPDAVIPVDKMGQALIDYVEHAPEAIGRESAVTEVPDDDASLPARLPQILTLVRKRCGKDFRWYRSPMLLRRLRRRMGLKSARDVDAYIALLEESDDELNALVKDFLINVTEFFRQPDAWAALEERVLPALVEERLAAGAGVRVWTPGCATGEESYSIAMLLLERTGEHGRDATVNVFASDVDAEALAFARAGSYPESIVDEVGQQRLARFFQRQGNRYVVRKEVRESVVFSPQDLVRDPPFSKLDLIVCRNVLIYIEPAQQSRILEVFHFALNPNGVLFLGKSESLGPQSELFEPLSRTHRIFRRIGTATRLPRPFDGQWSGPGGFLTPAAPPRVGEESDPAELVRAHLEGRTYAAAVLVNRDYRSLYFQGETSRFLQPSGQTAWDLLSLLRDGLRSRVRGALRQAITSVQPVEVDAFVQREGSLEPVRIRVEPVSDFARTGLLVVGFDDAPGVEVAPGDGALDGAAEAEVQRLLLELAAAERESEATTSELRVANEEAMSLNEELQSSNEELQTSKEELQSMNEELASVNSELEDKVDELERALADLRMFMDNTRVATLFLDRNLCIRRFTQEAARLFRVLPSDAGRPLRDIVSSVADPRLLETAADVLRELVPREAEVATDEGEWFLRRILPFRARDDRIEGVVVTYVEITALRKAAQDARHFATVLHDSNDAVIVHDFAGRILFWNDGAERAYGYPRRVALEMNIGQLELARASGSALVVAERVRTAGSEGPVITRRLRSDGRRLDVSVTVSALRDDAGAPYAVVVTERDITESLNKESELRFRAMADDIPMLLKIEDAAGQAQFLNRAWLAYTGESAIEGLLANGWIRYIHPDDLQGYLKGMAESRKNRTRYEGDMRLRRHDGSYRWIRTTAGSRRDDAGQTLGYVSVSVDVEDRKRAEQAIAREGERKDEFLAMLAHELRNPLFPVANAVAVIERCNPTDPKIAWAGNVIARQTQQLARLVDDLMDVARITSDKVAFTREPIEVAVLVERACEASQPLIDGRRQHLTCTVPPDRSYVEGDLVRLTQVLGNLLNNASKYSDQGSEIGLTVTSSPTEVVFSVTDHGQGISAEMLPRVFDLFAQEDRTLDRAQGGLGIGLSLVERLVRAHGGTVEARSGGRGCGSEFIVRLPCLPLRERANPEQPAQAHPSSRRILVVDDNVDGAESLAMLLEHDGHAVRTAKDGAEALVTASEFHPQIVLLDIGLPGMNGYEVARHLRGNGETSKALLVAMTGYGQPEDVARSKAAGFDHHVVKPVSLEKILDLVSEGAA